MSVSTTETIVSTGSAPANSANRNSAAQPLIIKPTFAPTEEYLKKHEYAEKHELFLSEKDTQLAVKSIRNTIKNEEARLRRKYKWLKYQDALGLLAFGISVISMLAVGYLYLTGRLHWALVVPLLALPASILHELEHDLIHNLYFKTNQWVHHVMYAVIYIAKFSVTPWYRKFMHLRHHQVSGSKYDLEERLIGSGLPFGFLRLALVLTPWANTMVLDDIEKDNRSDWSRWGLVITCIPTVFTFAVLWHLFFGYVRAISGLTITDFDPVLYLPLWAWPIVRDLGVLILLPNILRQACLNLMASYCHYYGDVPAGDVFYQGQVIDHWTMWPFQLFCFNFGATHIIHHFVPNQPFYIREAISRKANAEMIRHGVRNNDWRIVARNNRYYESSKHLLEADKSQVINPEQWNEILKSN
nr:unnamed protein product [Naegleria fowleri]